jgi:hypothetical protein
MGGFFGGGSKAPPAPAPVVVPQPTKPTETAADISAEELRRKRRRGAKASILTSPTGVSESSSLGGSSLLGE